MDAVDAGSSTIEGPAQILKPHRHRAENSDGTVLNAEFSVGADGDAFSLIIESAGGKVVGSPLPRNSDYVPLLELLLARLRELDATIVGAEVVSANATRLAANDRQLLTDPITMSTISDIPQCRLDLTRAQGRVGLSSTSQKEGNNRKRLLLRIIVPDYEPADAEQLAQDLSRSAVTIEAGDPIVGETDGLRPAKIRREQSRLRRILVGSGATGTCAVCGNEFPVSLLVAAHIKRREHCTEDERRDLFNVAMLACTFGCDALYEDGWISVDHTGRLCIADETATPAVQDRLAALAGRRCEAHKPGSAAYFDWHYTAAFRGRSSAVVGERLIGFHRPGVC
ncbi:hypothetical protein [Nocardia sp. NPDC057030]|uniref:hypothetical protein n=1 Tax=unclassified Nocardia TaxID=2637762 RepID=UPI0036383926